MWVYPYGEKGGQRGRSKGTEEGQKELKLWPWSGFSLSI